MSGHADGRERLQSGAIGPMHSTRCNLRLDQPDVARMPSALALA